MNPTFLHMEFNSNKFLDCIAIHLNFYRSLLVTYSLFVGLLRLFVHHCYDISLVSEARTPTSIYIYIYIYALSVILSLFFFFCLLNSIILSLILPGRYLKRPLANWLINVEKKLNTWHVNAVPFVSLFFFWLVKEDKNH